MSCSTRVWAFLVAVAASTRPALASSSQAPQSLQWASRAARASWAPVLLPVADAWA